MKKVISILTPLCALAAVAVLWLQVGGQFGKLQSGPVPLEEGTGFAEVQGQYISYQAAYPVGSYVEEYYSGDPDRVRRTGFVVYDEARQAFLYVIVPEQYDGRIGNLLWNLQLAVEIREGKDMKPYEVTGSLEPMDEALIEHALTALDESEIIGLYKDLEGDEVYMEAYFSDSYGETIAAMCDALGQGWNQADWYMIEDGSIGGMALSEIWISILAIMMSLLIFVCLLIGLLTGGRGKKDVKLGSADGRMGELLAAQREWVQEWCDKNLNRGRLYVTFSLVGFIVGLAAIGYATGAQTQRVLAFHFPLGLFLGEVVACMFWLGQRSQSKPEKILKKFAKGLRKALPSAGAQDAFAEDYLNTGKEWIFEEKKKGGMLHGKVGENFWSVFSWNGMVTVVDAQQLKEIETTTISGTVRSGKVRMVYASYVAQFYYHSNVARKHYDKIFSFDTEKGLDDFMYLAEKRTEGKVKIIHA